MGIRKRFPCVVDMRRVARRRIPRFAWDYLCNGIGLGQSARHNYAALGAVKLLPNYLVADADNPDCSTTLLGTTYARPFGVAPIGLGGLIRAGGAEALAEAAREHNIPFCLSGFATVSMEKIRQIGGAQTWYQHYMCADDAINKAFFRRAEECGYRHLVITVDVPTATRRDHDIRNGLSVPPRFNLQTLAQIAMRPRWALETLANGIPRFQNFDHLIPPGANLDKLGFFLQELIEGHVSIERLKMVRDNWPHNLIIKGILSERDAEACVALGAQAIVISNHGGRQLDAAHSALERLPVLRGIVGDAFPLIADGGVLNGLDIARYLACGADFVLCGRAMMYAVAALGRAGAAHVMDILFDEFAIALRQLGCSNIAALKNSLRKP